MTKVFRMGILRELKRKQRMEKIGQDPDRWIAILCRRLKRKVVAWDVDPSYRRMQRNEIMGLEFNTKLLCEKGLTASEAEDLQRVFRRIESLLHWSVLGVEHQTSKIFLKKSIKEIREIERAHRDGMSRIWSRRLRFDKTVRARIPLFRTAKEILLKSSRRMKKIDALLEANQQLIDIKSPNAIDPNMIHANSPEYRSFLRFLRAGS